MTGDTLFDNRERSRRWFLKALASTAGAGVVGNAVIGTDSAGASPVKRRTPDSIDPTTTTTAPPAPATTTTTTAPPAPTPTATTPPPPPPTAETSGRVLEIKAATDGTDQTAAIQAQINAAPNGVAGMPTVLRFPVGESRGTYRVEGTLYLVNKSHVVLEGPSPTDKAHLKRTQVSTADPWQLHTNFHVEVYRSSDIVVRNIFVESYWYPGQATALDAAGTPLVTRYGPENGARAGFAVSPSAGAAEREIAFQVCGSTNVLIENTRALNVRSYNCQVTMTSDGQPPVRSSNVTFRNMVAGYCGGWAACIVSASNVVVDNVRSEKCGFGGIDLEPIGPLEWISNVEIKNCRIEGNGIAFAANGTNAVDDVYIHDCHVECHNGWPLVMSVDHFSPYRRRNWRLERITHSSTVPCDNGGDDSGHPMQAAFYFRNMDNVTVRDCAPKIRGDVWARYMTGVHLDGCSGELRVENNNFNNALVWGTGAVRASNGTGVVSAIGNA